MRGVCVRACVCVFSGRLDTKANTRTLVVLPPRKTVLYNVIGIFNREGRSTMVRDCNKVALIECSHLSCVVKCSFFVLFLQV